MGSLTEYSLRIRQKLSEIYDNVIGRFINSLFRKPSSVLFLGIDNAGKTTLVNKLKNNTNDIFLPTKHATKDVVEIGNLKALVVDLGGHRAVRMAWKDYFYNVDGIVFIVDTADESRYEEVRDSWAAVMELEKEAPIIVLMNKIDLLGESTDSIANNRELMAEIVQRYGITWDAGRAQNIEIVYISILRESTYDKESTLYKAFSWLSTKIDARQKKSH